MDPRLPAPIARSIDFEVMQRLNRFMVTRTAALPFEFRDDSREVTSLAEISVNENRIIEHEECG